MLFLMWAVMMVAMMVPSAAPVVLISAAVNRNRGSQQRPLVPTGVFLVGYLGLRHGAYCVGCCWALMALLFVAGVMNLLWVAAITALVLIEKVVPRGHTFGRAAGAVMVLAGLVVLAKAIG